MGILHKNNLLYLVFFIVIMMFFNTFYSTYVVLTSNYDVRMTQTYGYCKNQSWGFYDQVTKKFDLKDQEIRIINNGGHVIIDPLFKEINQSWNKDSRFLMLLNFETKKNKDIYSSKVENIKNYSIKYKFGSCYLLELND